jgi:hypothetical protein
MKYIIDLERVNELTSPHPGDDSNALHPTAVFSVSRKLIRDWIEIWENRNSRSNLANSDKVKSAFDNLRYNKILLTEADLRERKLDTLLDENI